MKQVKKRLNITLPLEFYQLLKEYTVQKDMNISEAIRMSVRDWMERRIKDEMAEGYKVNAKDEMEMLEEFKYVDKEVW